MSTETPENTGEVPMVLPGLQGWAAAHVLAHTQPTGTQPAQLGRTTNAGFTALGWSTRAKFTIKPDRERRINASFTQQRTPIPSYET